MKKAFSLAKSLDVSALRAAFATQGRVEIRDFLGVGEAEKLRAHLLNRKDWTLVFNAGEKVYELTRAGFTQMTNDQRRVLNARIIEAAQHGFQYRYETIRVPDYEVDRAHHDTLLDRFIAFMSSRETLDILSEICGAGDVAFADGQATSYSSGHFLTSHDDAVPEKHRRAAYVLGLSPSWRPEWGGLLMFHRADGTIEEAFVPAIGRLRLFAVPSLHSVSFVTPLAPEPRIAITGWLRANGGG